MYVNQRNLSGFARQQLKWNVHCERVKSSTLHSRHLFRRMLRKHPWARTNNNAEGACMVACSRSSQAQRATIESVKECGCWHDLLARRLDLQDLQAATSAILATMHQQPLLLNQELRLTGLALVPTLLAEAGPDNLHSLLSYCSALSLDQEGCSRPRPASKSTHLHLVYHSLSE